ncbi:MAG: glycosyltransferase family 39 protein [Lysobacteraceae bacterium]
MTTPARPSIRTIFICAWILVCALKLWLAVRVPIFGDEAFYWLEGQHLAWAYSDLPGLSAWLARLGVGVGGNTPLGLRWPFLLLGCALPWLCVRIARRFDSNRDDYPDICWHAGCLALLLPLASTLGVLALPDVPLVFATLLAFDASLALLQRVTPSACMQLAIALALGAVTHYRFGIAVFAGGLGLLASREGRDLLKRPGVLLALAIGVLAWLPVLLFNLDQHDAGLRFQLVERHPWSFHAYGLRLQLLQPLLTGPLLYAAVLWALWRVWCTRAKPRWRLLAIAAGVPIAVFLVLSPFVDIKRVSFHWPLSAYLLLLPVVPLLLRRHRIFYTTMIATGVLWTAALFALVIALAMPNGIAVLARIGVYPEAFNGWNAVAQSTRRQLDVLPRGTLLVADNFLLAAELEFALDGKYPVFVLDHPLNAKHGRALQLALWHRDGSALQSRAIQPLLLVVEETALKPEMRESWNRRLCATWPGLQAIDETQVDDGRKRFLFFLHQPGNQGACDVPAQALMQQPLSGAKVSESVQVAGWAFQDVVGIARVDILLDGKLAAAARYGIANHSVPSQYPQADDPNLPNVGFHATLSLSQVPAGRHRLALKITGNNGRVRVLEQRSIRVGAIE